jgi:flagellar biosynthesis/type III secretory pathway protein FliH
MTSTTYAAIIEANLVPACQVRVAGAHRLVGRINGTTKPAVAETPPVTVIADVQAREIEALRGRLDAQADELRKLGELVTEREGAAYAKGYEAGEAKGRAAAVENEEARQTQLVKGVAAATAELAHALTGLNSMAASLAIAAVEQIVGEQSVVTERVYQVLRHQLVQLREALPMEVRVSTEDFSHLDALRHLLDTEGFQAVKVIADPALESGGCRIQLRLGEVDAGIRQQLRALANVLAVEPHASR